MKKIDINDLITGLVVSGVVIGVLLMIFFWVEKELNKPWMFW